MVHPADSQFPLFKAQAASSVKAVTLHPGEVLYVPPYWLVRAEFPVLSVFLDVPSLSEELVSIIAVNIFAVTATATATAATLSSVV